MDSWEACSVAAAADQVAPPAKEGLLKGDPVNGAKVGPRDADRVVVVLVDPAAVREVAAWNSIRSSA